MREARSKCNCGTPDALIGSLRSSPTGYLKLPPPRNKLSEIQRAARFSRSDADMHGELERTINYQHLAAQ